MGFVENADAAVVEATEKQVQPHPDVRDVRQRHQDLTVRIEMFSDLLQERFGIAQVLDDVAQNDCIVRSELREV